jgi:regulator of RNase E activity RraB
MSADGISNALAGHNLRNQELRKDFVRKRVNLDESRAIDLHFWSAEQRDAALLARALYRIDFLVLMLAPQQQEDGSAVWNVEAGIKEPISRIISSGFTERMVRLAEEHSSEYDGWGTSL